MGKAANRRDREPDLRTEPPWPSSVLLAFHATLAERSLLQENPTVDEVVHLPAGRDLLAEADVPALSP